MDRTAFDGKGTNYKRIDLSRSFLLRPNDRFIKIAKFFFPFIINSCMYAFFFLFPLQSHEVQGRCASRSCIVYYFTECSYSALDSKLREKRGIRRYSDSINCVRRVPGFLRLLYNDESESIESWRVKFLILIRKNAIVCVADCRVFSVTVQHDGNPNSSRLYRLQSPHIIAII